jgi:hypothetical protein
MRFNEIFTSILRSTIGAAGQKFNFWSTLEASLSKLKF